MALDSSTRVFHLLELSSSVCIRAQNDSTTALSKASPTVPIDWARPAARTRWLNVQEVY
jgi:hypothetical protein